MQQRAIRSGVHILVATPGRALDHISRGTIDLSNVKHVVLDEVKRFIKSCLSLLIGGGFCLIEYAF
jgi:ATP-dependent RNA helicase DeaD